MSITMEYYSSRLDSIFLLQKATLFIKSLFFLLLNWLTTLNHQEPPVHNQSNILRKAVRDSFQVSTYGEMATMLVSEETTCAVCLSEVRSRDRVWELRNCSHVFHKGCLDKWLDHDENVTCPLCRAPLVTQAQDRWSTAGPVAEPSWAVERLMYLFGDDLLLS